MQGLQAVRQAGSSSSTLVGAEDECAMTHAWVEHRGYSAPASMQSNSPPPYDHHAGCCWSDGAAVPTTTPVTMATGGATGC
jgi:hypothetical protein